MIIHFKIRKYKKYALAAGSVLVIGLALSGFFETREQLLLEAPAMKLEQEDISVKENVEVEDSQDSIPLVLQPTLATGLLEEMIYSDKLLAEYRMERQRLRGQETATLQEIIDHSETDSSMREQASQRLIDLLEKEEEEIRIEYLLKSAGVGDCVVMLEGEEVNILLPIQLNEEDLETTYEHVARIASVPKEQIYIVMREEGISQTEENNE